MPPMDMDQLSVCVSDCTTKIKQWTEVNCLALNSGKTEFLWNVTPRRRHLISQAPFLIDDALIVLATEVCLLGVLITSVM